MTTACSELPFTTAFHSDLSDMISPGQPVILDGYAGGGKRKTRKSRKKTKSKKLRKNKTTKRTRTRKSRKRTRKTKK